MIICISITLSLMIGLSRLYRGVPWFSDVAAGFALAGMWLAPMLATVTICCYRHSPATPGGRKRRHSFAYLVVFTIGLAFLTLYALGRLHRW